MSITFLFLTGPTQPKIFHTEVELLFTITISLCGFSTWLFVAGLQGVAVWFSCCLEHWLEECTSKYWFQYFCSKVICPWSSLYLESILMINLFQSMNFIVIRLLTCFESIGRLYWFKNKYNGDFPGNPVVKTPRFQCKGCGFDPWSGSWDPTCCGAQQQQK